MWPLVFRNSDAMISLWRVDLKPFSLRKDFNLAFFSEKFCDLVVLPSGRLLPCMKIVYRSDQQAVKEIEIHFHLDVMKVCADKYLNKMYL